MATEQWRQVASHPQYEVSNLGRVRRGERILRPFDGGNGYLKIALSRLGKVTKASVHRLVTIAFHGPSPRPQMDAAHWNGERHDNRAANLRWASRKENMADTTRMGRKSEGERNGHAKITEADVLEIRRLRAKGFTYPALSEMFGLTHWAIRDICIGKTWKCVGPINLAA